jgi:hypothetical protein
MISAILTVKRKGNNGRAVELGYSWDRTNRGHICGWGASIPYWQTGSGGQPRAGSRRNVCCCLGDSPSLCQDDVLADNEVQAVYIATPHPWHAEWSIKAAEAGKHILCEKPIALNHAQAMTGVEAAARHDVFLMEAYMYRCHPQTAKLVERSGLRALSAISDFPADWPAPGLRDTHLFSGSRDRANT